MRALPFTQIAVSCEIHEVTSATYFTGIKPDQGKIK